MNEKGQKIRPTLLELAVGDSVTFPISRLKSVRTQASELGAIKREVYIIRTPSRH